MGFLANMFSTQKNNQTTSNATSNTTGNDWSQLQPFFQNYLDQYSPSNISSATVPINPYQTAAADAQQTVAPSTQAAMGAANQIAGQGIDPNTISQFMSPYISSVVNPTEQVIQQQNQAGLSDLRGNQAARSSLGNNTGSEAAYLNAVQPAETAEIANLYNQGFMNAGQLAGTSTQAQLTGANTAGNIAGVNTGANTAAGNLGQNIWTDQTQNALTPFALNSQGASSIAPFTGAAGANTTSTGSGTSNTQNVPSVGGTVAGLAGAILGAFRHGGPTRSTGGKVEDDPMPKFESGDDFASKVQKAHKIVHHLRTKNTEAAQEMAMRPRFDLGGDVGLGSWGATVTPASDSGFNFAPAANALTTLSKNTMWGPPDSSAAAPQQAPAAAATDPNAKGSGSESALQRILDMVRPTASPTDRGFDDGGLVGDPSYAGMDGLPDSPSGPSSTAAMWTHMPALAALPDALNYIAADPRAPHFDTAPRAGLPGSPSGPSDPMAPNPANSPPPITEVADLRYGEPYPQTGPNHLGAAPPAQAAPPTPASVPVAERKPTESGGWWSDFKSMLPSREDASLALMSVGAPGDPFKDVPQTILAKRAADRAATQLGLEAAQNPAKIGALEAQSAPAQIAMKQAELANAQALQRSMLEYYMKLEQDADKPNQPTTRRRPWTLLNTTPTPGGP